MGQVALLAALYAGAGWLGLRLAVPPGYATIIWPASGIALAGLLLLGRDRWPGILFGSFVVNTVIGNVLAGGVVNWVAIFSAALIASGSTAQAIFARYLVRGRFGDPVTVGSIRNIAEIALLCGPVACVTAATIGVGSLYLTGVMPAHALASNWLTWWIGDIAGILIVVPIALLGPWRNTKVVWRGEPVAQFTATMVAGLAILLGATFGAWKVTTVTTYERNLASFRTLATDSEQALRNRLASYRQSLDGGAALFEVSGDVSLRQWKNYVSVLDPERTLPGISGIGFIQPVPRDERAAFEKRALDAGITGLTIHPETARREMFVITYIEPAAKNAAAIGLDIAFEANRRTTAIRSRDSGLATITNRISLVQDKTSSSGFLLLRPIYEVGKPTRTVAERRDAFHGWIYAPFVATKFMSELTASQGSSFEISVFDGDTASPANLIYASSETAEGAPRPAFSITRTFPVMEQNWTVTWTSTPAFEHSVGTAEPLLILFGGGALTPVFAFMLLSYSRREAYVKNQVDLKTRDLNDAVEALTESERRFGDLAGLSPAGIFRTDPYGFFTYVNEAWLGSTGLTASRALGAGWVEAIHPDDSARVRSEWMRAVGECEHYRTEFRFVHADDTVRWIDLICAPQFGMIDTVSGYIGVAIDITAHRQAVDALVESERRLQTLADLSPAGIVRTSADGALTYANGAWLRLAGQSPEDAQGTGWANALHPEDAETVGRNWETATREQRDFKQEFRFLHPNGRVTWVVAMATPEIIGGAVAGYVAVVLDVTEQKTLEFSLSERTRQLNIFAANVTDAVFRLDLEGHCLSVTPSVRQVLGLEPQVVLGAQILTQFHPDDEQRVMAAFRMLANGERDRIDVTYRSNPTRLPDTWIWLEASCQLARNARTNEPEEIVASLRDITERKKMVDDLDQARRDAEAAAHAKASFLANMSHEIRTPMNGVIGFTDLLLAGDLPGGQRRHAELIAESGKTMMRLLNDILDLSKIEAGQMSVANEPFDLRHTLKSCVRLMRPAATQKGLSLDIRLDPDLPQMVLGDGLRLKQILGNLIGNAIKFTAEGSVTLAAHPVGGREGSVLEITVTDTGMGIPLDRQQAIFGEFVQADAGTSRTYGGTGLGLSISRKLAVLMGGTIGLESEPGQGAVFKVLLPLVSAADRRQAGPREDDAEAPAGISAARILVAEDHDINQQLILALLERMGAVAELARNGAEAVEMVRDNEAAGTPFELVLMDVQMPEMDGLEATRQIRGEGIDAERLPIVALTANAYEDDIRDCLKAGMQAHLAKPVELSELVRTVARWTNERRTQTPAPASDPVIERLRDRYVEFRTACLHALEDVAATLPSPETQALEALRERCHRLAGTAAMFGDRELGDAASAVEDAIEHKDKQGLAATIRTLKFQFEAATSSQSTLSSRS